MQIELCNPHRGPATVHLATDGATLIRRFGRAGRMVHEKRVEHASPIDAQRALRRAAHRIIKKGYRAGAHHAGLIEAIAAAPDDPGGYAVYADWLASRGDPRAALIRATSRPTPTRAIRGLIDAHPFHFIRPAWDALELVWLHGFVCTVHTTWPVTWGDHPPITNAHLTRLLINLRRHPSGRFLRRLRGRYWNRGAWRLMSGPLWFRPIETGFAVDFGGTTEPMDLNRVNAAGLRLIPGVGAVLADRILDFRQAHGPLTRVEQLGAVKGIGPETLFALVEALSV